MIKKITHIYSHFQTLPAGRQVFKSTHRQILVFAHFLICTLFFSCAQIVSPTGGLKDETAPKAVKYLPDSMPVNFTGKVIRIKFNEYIQLKDISNQLVVSPPMKHQPDVEAKGKELIIEIEDTLKKNTTYTFNFGNAITDITEGNAVENFQYVFSTGPVIDSLSFSGTVKNAFTLLPEKGVLVMLYDTFDDSVPFMRTPSYFAKTKEDGSFKMNYIRKGKYKLFALKDANSNYLYDTPDEMIAFKDSLVELPETKKVELLMFKEGAKRQFIKSARVLDYGHVQIVFNRPIVELSISPLNFKPPSYQWEIEEFNNNRDTLNIWLPGFEKDSISFIVGEVCPDSVISNGKLYPVRISIIDTLDFKIPRKNANRNLKVSTSSFQNLQWDVNRSFEILFNAKNTNLINGPTPFIKLSKDSIMLNSLSFNAEVSDNILCIYPLNEDTVTKQYPQPYWTENSDYFVTISKGAVIDIFGNMNEDTINVKFHTRETKFYGTLKLNFITASQDERLLQLLGPSVMEDSFVKKSGILNYEYLNPGNYSMRLISDFDKNTKWSTGNYLQHLQPEKVIYYPKKITIRSNWDLEQEWKIE